MKVVYFVTESGRRPVEEFVDALTIRSQRKFVDVVELLEDFGRNLSSPHAKYIGNDLFELRFMGREGAIRILYFFFHREKVVFTNAFIKKSNKTPEREKNLATERRKIYFAAAERG